MANKKSTKKSTLRYDRVIGCLAVIGFGVAGVVNMFSTEVDALSTTTKSIVMETKNYVNSFEGVDIDKVKVDYLAENKEVQVNLVLGTSYELRSDVLDDSYAVALGLVQVLTSQFGEEIESCSFDVDLHVAKSYDIVTKQINDFKVDGLKVEDWETVSKEEFKSISEVVKQPYMYY